MTTRRKRGIVRPVKRRRKTPVTVCIATIYSDSSIFGISDRMLTSGSGDIEFEPPAKKIFLLTRCIAVMTAGDSSIQAQLLAGVKSYVDIRVDEDKTPVEWIKVSEVATKYRNLYLELRKERAEAAILTPQDLTYESFLEKQSTMSEDLVSNLSYKLENYTLDDNEMVSTIITGIDESGPHIYVVQNDYISNNDNVGFAAVGIGASHALSQLMLAGYSRYADEAKALLMIHRAKKKSEISPGVGKASDMFVIGTNESPVPGTFYWLENIKEDIIPDLDSIYEKYVDRNLKADLDDESEVQQYLDNLANQVASTQQEAPTTQELKLTDEVKVSDKVVKDEKENPRGRTRRKAD